MHALCGLLGFISIQGTDGQRARPDGPYTTILSPNPFTGLTLNRVPYFQGDIGTKDLGWKDSVYNVEVMRCCGFTVMPTWLRSP